MSTPLSHRFRRLERQVRRRIAHRRARRIQWRPSRKALYEATWTQGGIRFQAEVLPERLDHAQQTYVCIRVERLLQDEAIAGRCLHFVKASAGTGHFARVAQSLASRILENSPAAP